MSCFLPRNQVREVSQSVAGILGQIVFMADNFKQDLPLRARDRTRAKPLSDLMTGVLAETVARRSGMTLDLIAAWDEIAGPDYCECTMPERIRWPRRASDDDPFQPGMLEVACDSARAIFFQHESNEVLQRVNLFFGFEAVNRLRILQKPVKVATRQHRSMRALTPREEEHLGRMLEGVEDEELRKRLEKLARAVILKQSRTA